MSPTTTRDRPRPSAGEASGGGSGRGRGRVRMDPRISARRVAVTRQQGQRRLRLGLVALAATVLLVGVWAVLYHTPLFAARAVTVVGAVHESEAQVVAAAGLAGHPPLLDVNAGVVTAAVERLPWVGSATVSVRWPDGVRVVVHEETPRLAMALPGGKWAVVAIDGRELAVSAARPPGLLTFAAPSLPSGAGVTLSPRDDVGLDVAATLPASFAAQVATVTVEPAGWVQLAMTTPIVVDVGNGAQLPAKYEDVSAILAGATLHVGDTIDVSVPDAPTVTGP